ncbi:MAG: poly(R)-hydroxyalkanoic acid synthase, class, partial [Proteobacteria bacterium]|nr:poly(R)-hydroxyalkanoic acid synthase, class [Pseudomonadota bacterium]
MQKHAALWAGMAQRKADEPAPAVVAPEPGDRRFAAADWAESPYFDYLRQAYLINADFLKKVADSLPLDGQAKHRLRFVTR